MEEERLDVLRTFASGIAVANMTYGHLARQLCQLLLVEHFRHQTISLYPMELSVRGHRHNAASLLSSVLKGVQAIISQACCILNTIYAKHTTLVMQLVIPEFVTLTHTIHL